MVRAAMASPHRFDPDLWATLCGEIGVAALAVPEDFGGVGASWLETAAVLEQLGRRLTPVPMFGSAVLATGALLAAGDPSTAARLLPALAAGERTATLCWAGETGWQAPGVRVIDGKLSGTAHYVIDAQAADLLLVLTDDGGLWHLDTDTDGVAVVPLPVVDPTRPLARVEFHNAAATRIPAPDDLPRRVRTLAFALLSAEQVGAAAAALELTVDYTRSRKQFGRTIGSFQALKHRMADMYVLVESARSLSQAAIGAVVAGADDAGRLAAEAHVYCSEAFCSVAGEAIQLHGGIGITWEHDIGLYFKRAHGSAQLFGQPHEVVGELTAALLRE